ncbi:transcriptional regulator, AraC family [Paenibacillus uliginis N3/975]|uniref:Transcriptional regulator, AraC family n=1 Tax=Paenibacillus uliginis N3/975 TaxID=1313296 RepID=A0A1X7HFU0_9BACL|nr:AraC family transcriptional regulator [Paenibacillus uliginis]SMF85773.1 transcriptional regulator, AraC family [Paenibacillus uliginis N3/975]
MDWLDRMNSAIEYLETHLTETIDYDQIARIACCSTYHFQRMFSFIASVPLSEYIRRRRLTLAAFELQNSDVKVIDIALNYGYESPEAFSRAFKKMHGVMPKSARDKGVTLKAYPRLSFHISIRGDVEMNYKIEEKEAFEMFGVSTVVSIDGFVEIPAFWNKCVSDGTVDRIRDAANLNENDQIHGIKYNKGKNYSYMIGYFIPQSGLQRGFEKLHIAPQTYAIFTTGINPDGQSGILELWKRIWGEWFPTCNYELVNAPEFEMVYDRGNNMYETEIWIPIVKKLRS